MTLNFPPFTDLVAVASKLGSAGKGLKLKRCLDQAWRANSCLGDLKQAEDCCGILKEMVDRPNDDDSPHVLTTERALLTNGITLYARATSTSGQDGERGSVQLERGSMTKLQWEDHRLIVDIRNLVISHVYDARAVGSRNWHRSLFFAVEFSPGRWRPASAAHQTSFDRPAFEALSRAVPIAYQIILPKFHKRMRAVMRELSEAGDEALLQECRFDPITAFGSVHGVEAVLDMRTDGAGAVWSRE
ncbi:hypothetical protein BH09PSE3_BH09PSE3_24220 [soil metagenome]